MTQTPDTYSAANEKTAFAAERTRWDKAKIVLRKSPWSARFGMVVILAYMIVGLLAPIIAPYGEAEVFPVPFAPWEIRRADLETERVRAILAHLKQTGRLVVLALACALAQDPAARVHLLPCGGQEPTRIAGRGGGAETGW